MFGKRKNGAKYVWEVKDLHKIQDLMSKSRSQDKQSFRRNKDSLWIKLEVHKFVAFLTGAKGRLNVEEAAKNTLLLTKIMKIVSKTKAPKNSCIPHGSWGLAQCNFKRWTFIPCSAAKQGTNSPFKQEIVCLLTYSVLRNHSTNSIYSPPRTVKHWITRPRTARTYRRCPIMAYYLHPNMDKTKKVMQIWEIFK